MRATTCVRAHAGSVSGTESPITDPATRDIDLPRDERPTNTRYSVVEFTGLVQDSLQENIYITHSKYVAFRHSTTPRTRRLPPPHVPVLLVLVLVLVRATFVTILGLGRPRKATAEDRRPQMPMRERLGGLMRLKMPLRLRLRLTSISDVSSSSSSSSSSDSSSSDSSS